MNISPKIMRRYRCHLVGLLAGLPMASPATEVRDISMLNQGGPAIASVADTVRCTDGLLSVKARDIGLADLLDEVASQCGFTVVRYVALEQRLSVEFDRLTLEQGLQRILRSRSYALRRAPPTPGKRLAAVAPAETLWILPQGDEKYAAQPSIPATTSASRFLTDESALDVSRLTSALSNGGLEDREQAAVALGKRGHASAVAPLSQALADRNAEVQEAAIVSLAEIGGADAAHALAAALRDGDPRIRELAVDALGEVGGKTATGLLEQALIDEVAFVRQAATEMLEQLRSGTR